MMKTYLFFLFAAIFCFLPFCGIAQNFTVRESPSLVNDFIHAFFRIAPDHYLALNYSAPHGAFSAKRDDRATIATVYDKNLGQISSSPIKDLAGFKYETAFQVNGKMQLFFSDAQRVVYTAELDYRSMTFKGVPLRLFAIPHEIFQFEVGFSEDSVYSYVLCKSHENKGKDQLYTGVVLDKNVQVVNTFSFPIEGLREYITTTRVALSRQGMLYIISAINVKTTKSDFRPLQYLVSSIDKEGQPKNTLLGGLPQGLLDLSIWSAEENKLSFTGLLAKAKKSGFTTAINGTFESSESQPSGLRQVDLSTLAFFQNAEAKYLKTLGREGIPAEATLTQSFTFADGSTVLILDQSEVRVTMGSFTYTDTQSGNLYVVRFGPGRNLEWVQVVPKRQTEPTYPIFTGAIAMPDGQGGVDLFFHDDEKNENLDPGDKATTAILGADWRRVHLAAVHVSKDGSMTKKYIIDDLRADLLLAPAKPYSLFDGELIYTSYNLKSLGKSTYRIGMIKVKDEMGKPE
jgi:hypothetical protein